MAENRDDEENGPGGNGKNRPGFGSHPAGLSALFFAELWERFSYYGMRALLVLFMVAPVSMGGLGFETQKAGLIYGNYTMAVYMVAILGGFIADRFLGTFPAVLIGGAIIMCGHFSLAVPNEMTFFLGLNLIVIGTSLFKPNVSALVGQLYAADDERRDAGFSIFYMGINIGAFIAPLVTGFLAQSSTFKAWLSTNGFDPNASWHWGFAAAGVGMAFGLLVLFLRRRQISVATGHDRSALPSISKSDLLQTAGVFLATAVLFGVVLLSDQEGFQWLRSLFVIGPAAAVLWFATRSDLDSKRMAAVFVFFIAAMIFWAIFEQAGVTIALFAEKLTAREFLGWEIPSAWFFRLGDSICLVSIAQSAVCYFAGAHLCGGLDPAWAAPTVEPGEVYARAVFPCPVVFVDGSCGLSHHARTRQPAVAGGPVLFTDCG